MKNALLLISCVFLSAFLLRAHEPAQLGSMPGGEDSGFVPNEGQIKNQFGECAASVKYLWHSGYNMNVQLKADGISYDTYHRNKALHFHRLDVRFRNASPDVEIIALDSLPGVLNFYQRGKGAHAKEGLRMYKRVLYRDLYPGIDLLCAIDYSAELPRFKYDFVLHPGSDPSLIDIAYSGHDGAQVADTAMVFHLQGSTLTEHIPLSYLSESGELIRASYCMMQGLEADARSESLQIGIEIDEIPEEALCESMVIDPLSEFNQVQWSTYYGGSNEDVIESLAIDSLGILFITGSTRSDYNIASEGSHQGEIAGDYDAFVARFNQHGLRQWASYYGGSADDFGRGIAVNNNNYVYIVGETASADSLSGEDAYQPELAGGYDGFIARFNRQGTLIWDTYFGGEGDDALLSCVTLEDGSLYAVGRTESSTFASNDSIPLNFIGSYAGNGDAILLRMDAHGVPQSARYMGGAQEDAATSLHFSPDSSLYVGGYTYSPDGIALGQLLNPAHGGGEDGFLARLNANLNLFSAGYFGNQGEQRITGVVSDSSRVVFTGYTSDSLNYGHFATQQPQFAGGKDAFIMALDGYHDPMWFTYLGGDSMDVANDISIDRGGQIYVVGSTNSANNIDDLDSNYTQFNGGSDAFVARYDSAGYKVWGRYFGGPGEELGLSVAAYGVTAIFFGGSTAGSYDLSESTGRYSSIHQEMPEGTMDGFLGRITQPESTPPSGISSGSGGGGGGTVHYNEPQLIGICLGDSIQIGVSGGALGIEGEWIWYESSCGDTDSFIDEGQSIWVSPVETTSYFVRAESVHHIGSCTGVTVHVDLPNTAIASIEPDTVACEGTEVTLMGEGGATFVWSGPDSSYASTEQNPVLDSLLMSDAGVYQLVAITTFGCVDTTTVELEILPAPTFDVEVNPISCPDFEDASILAIAPDSAVLQFHWPHAELDTALVDGLAPGTYTVIATDTLNCSASITTEIDVPVEPLDSLQVEPDYCDQELGSILLSLNPHYDNYEVLWTPGDLEGTAIDSLLGQDYTATILFGESCTHVEEVEVPNLGFFEVSIVPDSLYLELEEEAQLGLNISPSVEVASYLWEPEHGLSCVDCAEPIANPDTSIIYVVEVTSIKGCSATDTIFVERELPPAIPFIPNVFSPNGDGLNDELCVMSSRIVAMQLEIYNRQGQLVFESMEQDQCWDGSFKGSPAANGAYIYSLHVSMDDGETVRTRGNVTLVR